MPASPCESPALASPSPGTTAQRHRLLARIRRNYQVVTQQAVIGALRFAFTRVADPDRVLDEVAAAADLHDRLHGSRSEGSQLHLPYWAELWDSAWGMGKFLERTQAKGLRIESATSEFSPQLSVLGPTRVLDLGCGMGLSGTVAAALGARVVFADLEAPALLFAALNSLPWRRHVRTRKLDWQRDRLPEKFDLILGADILYERTQWPFLEPFWRAHLAPGGSVLLGEPGRQTGDLFVDWIKPRGWVLTRHEETLSTRPKPIRLLHVRPAEK
jgi:2-polyprenyl-3-methyl-5-hydroxy-6-metoxy-1,4-benzoquinol methylase